MRLPTWLRRCAPAVRSLRQFGDWLWRWSPVATLPVAILFLGWAAGTWHHYRCFRLEYDAWPVAVKLRDVGSDEWNNLARRTAQAVSGRGLHDIAGDHALNTVQLFVEGSEMARLNSDLPYSGFEYRKGQLMFKDGLREVDVRYRGDFLVHWGYDKKSIRVRTKKDELFEGIRTFNLIVPKFPEQVNNYLGYRLADILGVISPRCELVNVTINGSNAGLYEFTEQLDEGTLRRFGRMPGDLYSGDLIGKTQVAGTSSRVFDLPQLWEKVAANNHRDLASRAPLERLLELLNDTPSEENQARLSQLLDMRAWGAFGAFEVLTQTHHFDEYHNWRLYWDPWALAFVPVVWDPIPWAPEMRPAPGERLSLDLAISRLHVWLHQNGDWLAARHAALRDFFDNGKVEQFVAEVDWAMSASQAALELDPNVRPTDPDAVAEGRRTFREFVDRVLREVRLGHLDQRGRVRYTAPDAEGRMALEVSGRQPVDEVVLEFQAPLPGSVGAAVRIRRGDEVVQQDVSGGVFVRGTALHVPARLLCQLRPTLRYLPGQPLRQRWLEETPGHYELLLSGIPGDHRLLEVATVRGGSRERAEPVAELPPGDMPWLYRAVAPRPLRAPQVWSGEVVIDGVRDISSDVLIEPGTLVRLQPGASILFRGRVTAAGTADAPIRFVPAQEQQAWGTIALAGAGCNGSTLRHCKLRGGSGYKAAFEEYCSMFSVHNCRDVRIEDSRFADNSQYDDVIHAMYAEVVFDRVELVNAFADGLDCDISDVVVRNSRFASSGNDGIDLMTTRALVHDCHFQQNGDKGISIGEGSALIAVRNRFDGCVTGMEAKDGSVAHIANCEVRACRRALNAYRKNWRYDAGGTMTVWKSVFAANRSMPTADAHSRVRLVDCQLDAAVAGQFFDGKLTVPNRVEQQDCDGGPGPRHRWPLSFPRELDFLEAMAAEVWATARTDVRGGVRDD